MRVPRTAEQRADLVRLKSAIDSVTQVRVAEGHSAWHRQRPQAEQEGEGLAQEPPQRTSVARANECHDGTRSRRLASWQCCHRHCVTVICRSSTLGNSQPHTDLDTVMGTMVVEEGRGGDGRAQRLKVCAIANQVWPKP